MGWRMRPVSRIKLRPIVGVNCPSRMVMLLLLLLVLMLLLLVLLVLLLLLLLILMWLRRMAGSMLRCGCWMLLLVTWVVRIKRVVVVGIRSRGMKIWMTLLRGEASVVQGRSQEATRRCGRVRGRGRLRRCSTAVLVRRKGRMVAVAIGWRSVGGMVT